MKISVQWVNQYLDAPVDPERMEKVLTGQGLPIEDVDDAGVDTVLDVEITSNRSDCLSHVGIAREIAAGTGVSLKPPDCSVPAGEGEPVSDLTSVEHQDEDACPRYTARVIRGVGVGPSPDWLVRNLEAVGLRSVNNVVDVTNFVLLELGQPLHAFDMALLEGRRIVVRRAAKGERFTAIDASEHGLDDAMLMIADGERPVAVAGVMGGKDSEVGTRTTDVLLESAIFAPLSVRRTSRGLKLASDSSYRFERGVDPEGVERASARAAALIVELAGGTLAPGVIETGRPLPEPRRVTMRAARCRQLLGCDIPSSEMVGMLSRLGLDATHDGPTDEIRCTVPTFRLDLRREVDLIEEIARLRGLDDVKINQRIEIVARSAQPPIQARQELGRILVAHGFHETITPSFLSPAQAEAFVEPGRHAALIDPQARHGGTRSEPALRPSVIPSLLLCRKMNQEVGNAGVALFEQAATWVQRHGEVDGGIVERRRLGLLADAAEPGPALRSMSGTLTELVAALAGEDRLQLTAAEKGVWFDDGLEVRLGDSRVGALGVVCDRIASQFDLQLPVVAAEIEIDDLIAAYPPQRQVTSLPRFPGIERELSLIVDEAVTWSRIASTVREPPLKFMEDLEFLGTYRGRPIPKGSKSVSARLRFLDPQQTLRAEAVDEQMTVLIERLQEAVGAKLRT
ncbi:MAG: phenylalanine--tRNA ligase subunit beta [Phycisphaeraceae bacterium]|nr:phenylalanine--tRNA ligase subunit beta [Phycisphaeraceae bacterium]